MIFSQKGVIGFDFDMTLVDTSKSLRKTLGAMLDYETERNINYSTLSGLSLEKILLNFFQYKMFH